MFKVGDRVFITHIPETDLCSKGALVGKIIEQIDIYVTDISELIYWVTLDFDAPHSYYVYKKDILPYTEPNDILKDLLCLL